MKTWQTVDRSSWKNPDMVSPDEPDKAQWIDSDTGLDCLIVRGPSGALCGYVGVPEGHKFFEVDYDNVEIEGQEHGYPDVHGGLTFAGKCRPQNDPARGICHTGDVANKVVWWLGFDCAHLGDKTPAYDGFDDLVATYKTFSYVKQEVTGLARQLAA